MVSDVKQLSSRLGYEFTEWQLLDVALTHRSVKKDNNERYEFLGDSIVNFVIADALYRKFPSACEGQLSRLRSSFVKGETLALLAREFGFSEFLRLGQGERKSGGFRRTSILADAFEAVIAAIYLDSDLETCRALILNWYAELLDKAQLSDNLKDPKTRLQEYLQAQRYPLPLYHIDSVTGDAHDQEFIVSCKVDILGIETTGQGKSRRRAEQSAAEQFLQLVLEKDEQ